MQRKSALHVVILAAGRGKRMQTNKPKVLHQLAAKPMIQHVLDTAKKLHPEQIHIIIGHEADKIRGAVQEQGLNFVMQTEQKGTGHAVMQALPFIEDDANVLVLSGDVPLTQLNTLEQLIDLNDSQAKKLSLLVAKLDNPFGFGRIDRDINGEIRAVVEEKDASLAQKAITEIYTGICVARAKKLKEWLPKLSTNNAQSEYYLTAIIEMAAQEKESILSIEPEFLFEIQGVNTLKQLHDLERSWQLFQANCLLEKGVQISDISRLDIRGQVLIEADVCLDIDVILEGDVKISQHASIGAHSIIKNSVIGRHCVIHPHSIVQDAVLEDHCEVGPFARLRPGTHLEQYCKVGNFVELKKAHFGLHSKASHLSYIGDAVIGQHVNIGAGTITCNYDGVNKHQTIIKDHAFIGSDTQLVAPVVVGAHATIGAGTTLRDDAPDNALTLTPSRQKSILSWKRPEKEKL
jgi:bifunctional UDP-N-acetylglucosamine pyrophosphorylase / glucosamine-1-phosphate N-acetyltransferase